MGTDACGALANCCGADDAGGLYCVSVTSVCAEAFQYELNYGFCSGYTYVGFVVDANLGEPAQPGATGAERGSGDGGGVSSSTPRWTPDAKPSAGAVVETDACAALADCCAGDDAGDLYCDVTSSCDRAFQYELNYGFCSSYTYVGFQVGLVSEPATPGDQGGGDAG